MCNNEKEKNYIHSVWYRFVNEYYVKSHQKSSLQRGNVAYLHSAFMTAEYIFSLSMVFSFTKSILGSLKLG